jgi:hypothetical protein
MTSVAHAQSQTRNRPIAGSGYLGGAVASQLRIGAPLFSHILFPAYVAALLWSGLYLRETRLRGLLPVRR